MSRLRVLLIGRNYWPHGSYDAAGFLLELTAGLGRRGVHVEVLTPRFSAAWPDRINLGGITVHRPAPAPRRDWAMGRYVRQVSAWLREHGPSYDVWYCNAIAEDANAAVDAGRAVDRPVVLRHQGWGQQSDLSRWSHSRAGKRALAAAKQADRVVVSTVESQRALLGMGVSPARLERIDNGFAPGAPQTSTARAEARKALATANSDLAVSVDAPVVVCVGRMTSQSGMNRLARCAAELVARFANLRLWFIGDGPERETLYAALKADGVRASISMPGSFIDLDELLAAADVFVQTDHDGLDYFVRAAVSAELPLVMIDDEVTRAAIGLAANEVDPYVEWVREQSVGALRTAIEIVLDDLPQRRLVAAGLRRRLVRTRPLATSLDAYYNLFAGLAGREFNHRLQRSTGAAS